MMLKEATPGEWLGRVLSDFDSFLVDHAACERKASATALTFVSHYPDRAELVSAMIQLAREELDHFQRVYQQLVARGLQLGADTKDLYVVRMRNQIRREPAFYLMDRLLVAGVVEARGCERFGMVAEAKLPREVKDLYKTLSLAEAHHHQLFIALARRYFSAAEVVERLNGLLEIESEIMKQLPLRAALH
jgi:tRNA-(ms[2]io[6]A)-hydroxylase